MHLSHLIVTLAVVFAAAYAIFWSIRLFEDQPRPIRVALLMFTAAVYVVMQGMVVAGLYYSGSAMGWVVHQLSAARPDPWSVVMFVSSLAAALRLVTFRRRESRHRVGYAILSWFLVSAFTGIAIKIAFGIQPPPGPIQAAITASLASAIILHHGNLAHVLRHYKQFGALIWRGLRR